MLANVFRKCLRTTVKLRTIDNKEPKEKRNLLHIFEYAEAAGEAFSAYSLRMVKTKHRAIQKEFVNLRYVRTHI